MQTFMEEAKEKSNEKTSPTNEKMSNNTTFQKKFNRRGLPEQLKGGIEKLSGLSMDDVIVHYNSSKPAQMKALAYTQGTDIHVAPGQEKHLGHEAWHVVQQKQGRVKSTTQMKGINVNDDSVLEQEADVMGKKAVQMKLSDNVSPIQSSALRPSIQRKAKQELPVQCLRVYYIETNQDNPFIKELAEKVTFKRIKQSAKKRDVKNLENKIGNIDNLANEIKKNKSNILSVMQKLRTGNLFTDEEMLELNDLMIQNHFVELLQKVSNRITEKASEYIKDNKKLQNLINICNAIGTLKDKYETLNKDKKDRVDGLDNIEQEMNKIRGVSLSDLNNENYDKNILNENENVVIVSHGKNPEDGVVRFAGKKPEELANDIEKIIPKKYKGEIYLNGCYTGMPCGDLNSMTLNNGTSFAEQFGQKLVDLLTTNDSDEEKYELDFTVKGNLNVATYFNDKKNIGKMGIALNDKGKKMIVQKENLIKEAYEYLKKEKVWPPENLEGLKLPKDLDLNKLDASMCSVVLNKIESLDTNKKEEAKKFYNIIRDNKKASGKQVQMKDTEKKYMSGSWTKMHYHFSN